MAPVKEETHSEAVSSSSSDSLFDGRDKSRYDDSLFDINRLSKTGALKCSFEGDSSNGKDIQMDIPTVNGPISGDCYHSEENACMLEDRQSKARESGKPEFCKRVDGSPRKDSRGWISILKR